MNTEKIQTLKETSLFKRQQGDVKFYAIDTIPLTKDELEIKKDPTLVYGATGHHHTVNGTPESFTTFREVNEKGDIYFLDVRQPVTVTHEEHAPISLSPGTYFVDRVVEVGMFDDMVNPVAD